MTATATLAAFELELDASVGAVDALRGDLPVFPEVAGRDRAELLEECRGINTDMLHLRIERAIRVLEIVRQSGPEVTSRRQAIAEIAVEINTSDGVLLNDLRVLRYLTPDEILSDYQTLKITHLHDAARLTARAGEAPDAPERTARVREALNAANDEHLNTGALRERLLERQREDDAVCMQTPSGDVLLPPRLPGAPRDADSDWRQRVERLEQLLAPERLTDGLNERFRREAPGTWPDCVLVVREHLAAKLGGPR